MSDPATTAAAKVAEEMLKEVQAAAAEAGRLEGPQKASSVEFHATLEAQVAIGREVGVVDAAQSGAVDRLRDAVRAQRTVPAPVAGTSNDTRPLSQGMHRMFDDILRGQKKLEQIIDLSVSGKNFSPSELLALQAGVYRFTQELELTSKVVEKGTSTIKQTLNTQV